MSERQKHGNDYVDSLCNRHSLLLNDSYTGKWDASGGNFQDEPNSMNWNGKTVTNKGSICLGDMSRMFNITDRFYLSVGLLRTHPTSFFLCQNNGRNFYLYREIIVAIDPIIWTNYFSQIATQYIREMSELLRNISPRGQSQEDDATWKRECQRMRRLYGEAIIMPNPKRDSKGQKRLQCSVTQPKFLNTIVLQNKVLVDVKYEKI